MRQEAAHHVVDHGAGAGLVLGHHDAHVLAGKCPRHAQANQWPAGQGLLVPGPGRLWPDIGQEERAVRQNLPARIDHGKGAPVIAGGIDRHFLARQGHLPVAACRGDDMLRHQFGLLAQGVALDRADAAFQHGARGKRHGQAGHQNGDAFHQQDAREQRGRRAPN